MRISDWSSDVCSSDLLVFDLGLLLAAERQNALLDGDVDILLVETRKLGNHPNFGVGLAELEVRPRQLAAEAADRRKAEPAEDIVEQSVDVAVKRQERVIAPISLGAARTGEPGLLPAPGHQITNSHEILSFQIRRAACRERE